MKMTELKLANIDLANVEEIPAIYQIRNVVTDYVLISATENLKSHLKSLLYSIKNAYDRIPEKLVKDFKQLGEDMFVIDILQSEGINKDNMAMYKDSYLEREPRIYNVKRLSKGGGFEVVSNEAYVLNLNGDIVSEHPSVQAAYNSLGTAPHYGGVNTSARVQKVNRVVTKEFYNKNLKTILTWNNYNDYAQYRSELYRKSAEVSIVKNKKRLVFGNMGEVADYLKCSKETVRLILKGVTKSNPYNIQFANPTAIEELEKLKQEEKNKKSVA